LQDQHGGGSDGDRQQDEPGILPALAVPHETRLRLRAAPGQQGAATIDSRDKIAIPAQARRLCEDGTKGSMRIKSAVSPRVRRGCASRIMSISIPLILRMSKMHP
jgi:hypothetical protein